ncbi:hypothetical protein DM01DRAFT_1333009 [Hesseltinella vesiculosa]|uniref:P/Homo B domain-containing protein n=1 Tax=Hesseltinella vesiculosa TaxID=101127 RepID=A0A1X2GR58_9FUNG|nr:hypothetical protein DM01DRAFT_1333009 [Hesseltinella vesiculosa]
MSLAAVHSLRPQTAKRRLAKRAPPPLQADPVSASSLTPADLIDMILPVLENIEQEFIANTMTALDYLQQPDGFAALKNALAITDPGFDQQWHLVNQEQHGNDLNVTGVWSQGITGQGVVVAILDDGLDMDHDDLRDNFYAAGSYDFNDHTELPRPRLSDDTHGTRCAGEIAAMKNDVCGVGVAPDAKVAGVRILSGDITDEDEARALNYKYQENHIYSCSWGPPDFGEVAEAPEGIVLDAIKNGIANGRNGTGTIFVFASGNGGGNDDNCNFDGYTNSIYTITVGAIDRLGHHPYYAEPCSAQLVVTYSSGSGGNIYTTDIGNNQCTDRHGGTSAAAPLAAGVFALVLSVRPDLTWRDLQHLCVLSAQPFSLEDSDWTLLPSGRMYNHKFGYGKLDAYAIVELAKTFTSVGPQTYLQLSSPPRRRPIPDRTITANQDLVDILTITEDMIDGAGLSRVEQVTATVFIEHGRRGDLEILLTSPHNVTSQLGTPRRNDVSSDGLLDWTFMSVQHWEEDPVGDWTLRIIDWKNGEFTGYFTNWTLTLWGERAEEFEGELVHVPVLVEPVESQTTTATESIEYDQEHEIEHEHEHEHEHEQEQEQESPSSATATKDLLPAAASPTTSAETDHHEDEDEDEDRLRTPVLYSPQMTGSAAKSTPDTSADSNDTASIPPVDIAMDDNGTIIANSKHTSFPTWLLFVPVCGLMIYFGRRRWRRHGSSLKDANYTSLLQTQTPDTTIYEFDTLNATPNDTSHDDDLVPLIAPSSPVVGSSSGSSSREPSPTMKRQRTISPQ